MFRFAAYRIHQSLVQKHLTINEFWPLWRDKKTTGDKIVWGNTPEEARANYRKTLEKYNLLKKDNLN